MTNRTRRWWTWIAVLLAGVFLSIQVRRPDRTNPPVVPERGIETRLEIPEAVLGTLRRACRDCHSHETRWPWYSGVAPVSWIVAHDVEEGRGELNFSEWGRYGRHEAAERLGEMCEEIRGGSMPLRSYRWLHRKARLDADEVRAICAWTEEASRRLVETPADR